MAQLTVDEAAETYVRAMRNVLPVGEGICHVCHTFVSAQYSTCRRCGFDPQYLDTVVPITYSEHLSQMHTVLRGFKDGTALDRQFMQPRVAAILWKFLDRHEPCVAHAAGSGGFEVVATVPSSSAERDEHN